MSDLISRQVAIDALGEAPKYKPRIFKTYKEGRSDQWFDDVAKLSLLPSVENKGEWIPVSERLPEIHQDVLLSLRSLDIEVGFRAETEPYFYCHGADGCYIEPQNVLAWQPLPEPYKAESIDPNDLTHIFDGVTEIPKDVFNGWYTEKMLEQTRAESEEV